VVICAEGLGVRGARLIPALLITITGVGWFGVQAAVCGTSFSVMAAVFFILEMRWEMMAAKTVPAN
jgi:purine-cytosine permease-like protein